MAVYNDMDLLPGAVKSLKDLDRIVIVDGAVGSEAEEGPSTDGTIEYVMKLADEDDRVTVVESGAKPWEDKIAKRNQYLLGHEGDWYFVLEPFERAYGLSELKWFLPQAEPDVFSIQYLPQPWAEEPLLLQRLFRHLPGMKYEGTPDKVVAGEKVIVDPSQSVAYLTDQDPLISPRIVSVMHKRLKGRQQRQSLL
ncbi:MAG: glycosyltransferase family 2 protein [Actinobacteria bacterium]|nr:MAG: glycosyltransferase family 2 protein [Actinomycetota bacterium]